MSIFVVDETALKIRMSSAKQMTSGKRSSDISDIKIKNITEASTVSVL